MLLTYFIVRILTLNSIYQIEVNFSISKAPAQYIRYTPSQEGVAFNSGAKQRVIQMVEVQRDPIEPPKFK